MRPLRVVVVTGTGTDVGKTWVAEALIRHWREAEVGLRVAARKPVQSFAAAGAPTGTDAHRLATAGGEAPTEVCPAHRWYPTPMAPPMAAAYLGRPVPTIADLASEVGASWPCDRPIDVAVVEGAGGVAAPLADDGDTAGLSRALAADLVVVVADPGLGTINAVRLSVGALTPLPVVVFLNRFDPNVDIHSANRDWLGGRDGFMVATDIPSLAAIARPASRPNQSSTASYGR